MPSSWDGELVSGGTHKRHIRTIVPFAEVLNDALVLKFVTTARVSFAIIGPIAEQHIFDRCPVSDRSFSLRRATQRNSTEARLLLFIPVHLRQRKKGDEEKR